MKAFIWFIALLAAAVAAIAALTYPLWAALYPYFGFPFHRVADRVGMLALALGFVLVARRLKLADRASLGYGVRPRVFLRDLGVGFALGAPMMALVVAVMVALGLRDWKPGVTIGAASLLAIAAVGLARGFAVALIEETFLRGAMFSGIARESGPKVAAILTALVYAATHFVGHSHSVDAAPGWGSGLKLLGASFGEFAHPLGIADAYLSLFAVGVVLAMVRAETGHIGACMGLHASWVWVITFVRETSVANRANPLAFLLSRFDGVVGWLVLGWTIVLGLVLYAFYSRYSRRESSRGPVARAAG
ncbi:MAG TPA: CPBP family intramembrane glutamic endopeptidase [Steroidobacteraceae bacterium]|nr:CPBP family intramembrane glutamic endopeptidase [Steroidobacteraceae bacterium]